MTLFITKTLAAAVFTIATLIPVHAQAATPMVPTRGVMTPPAYGPVWTTYFATNPGIYNHEIAFFAPVSGPYDVSIVTPQICIGRRCLASVALLESGRVYNLRTGKLVGTMSGNDSDKLLSWETDYLPAGDYVVRYRVNTVKVNAPPNVPAEGVGVVKGTVVTPAEKPLLCSGLRAHLVYEGMKTTDADTLISKMKTASPPQCRS